MFKLEKDDAKIGEHLKLLIEDRYTKVRKFCIAYLNLRDGQANDEEIRKMSNRFSQILKGTKKLQIDDLPYVTELLGISCEEVLTAGELHVPISSHITNYEIAFSHDRDVWDRYMKRGDNLFLNCDEYCKSVIDYALEFKNYEFIKYLLEEKFIWFVDLSDWRCSGFTYGAGTSVKRRDPGTIDTHTPLEIQYQDKLRTSVVALAIGNDDFEMLDSLLAREIPDMRNMSKFAKPPIDFQKLRDDVLVRAIALGDKKAVNYFSQEFSVTNKWGENNTFVYPFLDHVIKTAIENGKNETAEFLIKRAIKHNNSTFSKLQKLTDKAYEYYSNINNPNHPDLKNLVKRQVIEGFWFDESRNMISYNYNLDEKRFDGLVTNIIRVDIEPHNDTLKKLLNELNESFENIVSMKGEN